MVSLVNDPVMSVPFTTRPWLALATIVLAEETVSADPSDSCSFTALCFVGFWTVVAADCRDLRADFVLSGTVCCSEIGAVVFIGVGKSPDLTTLLWSNCVISDPVEDRAEDAKDDISWRDVPLPWKVKLPSFCGH
jgi:hypothetical protein